MQRFSDIQLNYREIATPQLLADILENVQAAVRIYQAGGKRHEVVIKPPRRSNPQNDKWHTLLRAIAAETGHSVEEIKHAVKTEFLGEESFIFAGKEHSRPRESSGLTEREMSDLITQTEALYADLS